MFRPLAALLLFAAVPALAQQAPLTPEQAGLKAHIQFLAADALRGREAGTPDFDVAAEYVAARMLAMGLTPGGEGGGWFQPVKLATYRPAERAIWQLRRGGAEMPFVWGKDFFNDPIAPAPDFKAEVGVVFAGYGIVYPEGGRDDYRGLDVRGKIVAILGGTPAGLPSDVNAHFDDDAQKARLAGARGARAVLVLESARQQDVTFERMVPYYATARSTWVGPDGVAHGVSPRAPVVGHVSRAGAVKLFQGAAIGWAEVQAADAGGGRMPTGPLATSLSVASKTQITTRESRNVVGMIAGSDPALKDQIVVLSAHLDHVGVGEAVKGDTIYNGAMDNAAGVSMVLEIARAIQESGKRPRRSLLVVALTAEEKGLIGSDYFVRHPTVAAGSIVADVNLDMPILTYPLVDLVVLGGERSSIGPVVAAAARAEGLGMVPDPAPEEMFFVRSDHYSFVQGGIPAVSIDTGPGGSGAAASRAFLTQHYHQPSDQIDLPFDWKSAVTFKRVGLNTVLALANADARPAWNKGDFFGTLFGGGRGQ